MPVTTFKRFEEISLADAVSHEYQPDNQINRSPLEIFLDLDSANAGTIQFEAAVAGGSPAFTGCKAFPASTKLTFTIPPGFSLFAKASAATQKFTATY
jgi:hypothetical protein